MMLSPVARKPKPFPSWPTNYFQAKGQVWEVTNLVRRISNLKSGSPEPGDVLSQLETELKAKVPSGYYLRRKSPQGKTGYGVLDIRWRRPTGAYAVTALVCYGLYEGEFTELPLLGEEGLVRVEEPEGDAGGPAFVFDEWASVHDIINTHRRHPRGT